MFGLGGQSLELLGKLEQFRFRSGADDEAHKSADLASLLAVVIGPGFCFRHYRPVSPPSISKASN